MTIFVLQKCFVLSTFSFKMSRFLAPMTFRFLSSWVDRLVTAPRCSISFSDLTLQSLGILVDIPFWPCGLWGFFFWSSLAQIRASRFSMAMFCWALATVDMTDKDPGSERMSIDFFWWSSIVTFRIASWAMVLLNSLRWLSQLVPSTNSKLSSWTHKFWIACSLLAVYVDSKKFHRS